MNPRDVEFWSDGNRLAATVHDAADPEGAPIIVHATGWMSARGAAHYRPYYEALNAAGFTMLSFDYRAVGTDDDGPARRVRAEEQLVDLYSAVEYALTGFGESTAARTVGVLGTGGAGGALALQAAAGDDRIGCVAALWPIADGMSWLLSLRTPQDRTAFLAEVRANAAAMASGQPDRQVEPSYIVPKPRERERLRFKSDIADRVPQHLGLSTADSFRALVPIDVVHRIAPRATLLVGCEDDVIVPFANVEALFEAARAPKRLLQLRGTTSYQAYSSHFHELSNALVDWFSTQLPASKPRIRVRDDVGPPPSGRS